MRQVMQSVCARLKPAQHGTRSQRAILISKPRWRQSLPKVREAALQAGISGKELEDQLAAVREKYAEKTKKASTATVTAYQSIMVAINEKIAATEQEITTGEKQTEADKLRVKYQQELITRSRDFTKQQRAEIEAGIERLAAQEAYNDALEYSKKVSEDYAKKQDQQIQKISEQVEKLRLEEEGHKLAADKKITHAEAMERLTLARLEDAREQMKQGAGTDEEIARLDREIAKRRELLELLGAKGTREANEKAAKDLEKQWEKTAQTVGDTLADYIMGGGKDAATYLKRLFSTLVLQPVVQGLFSTGSAQAGQAAAAGGSNAMSLASSGQSLWSAFSGNLTATLGGTIATLGTSFGVSAATAFGSGIAAGGSLGLTAGLSQGAALVSAGGTAAGIGTMIGAVAPYAAAAVALYSIIKSFDNSGTPHYGAGAIYQGGNVTGGKDIYNLATFGMGARGEWTQNAQTNVSSIAKALGTALDSVATSFGQKAGYSIYTAFADDSSSDGAWGSLKIADAMGNVLTNWENTRKSSWAPRIFSNGEEGYKEYLNSIALDVKSAFIAMDLPAWADQILYAAQDLDSLNSALTVISQIKSGFDSLGKSMQAFNGITAETQTMLLQQLGSFENVAAAANTFYQNFYTEDQRARAAREQLLEVMRGFGAFIDPADGEQAKQQFKQLVETSLQAGQGEFAAKLLAISGSFSQIADYAQTVIEANADAAEKAAKDAAEEAALAALDAENATKSAIEAARQMAEQTAAYAQQALDNVANIAAAALADAQSAANAAYAQLEASINREKEYWQESANTAQDAISQISSAIDNLKSNSKDLYASVSETAQAQAVQGSLYIESALAAVRNGASITSFGGLSDAISAARGGLTAGNYATEFERKRDALVLAGQLTELGTLSDDQLSTQERMLKAANAQIKQLDDSLQYWRDSLDMDNQQIDATMSVSAAVERLAMAVNAQAAAAAAAQAAAQAAEAKRAAEEKAKQDAITAGIKGVEGTGATAQGALYAQLAASGMTHAQIVAATEKALGYSPSASDWQYIKEAAGLPSYAVGTPYVPEDQLAMLHEGEMVVPKQYNPNARAMTQATNSGQSQQDARLQNAALLSAINQLLRVVRNWDLDGLPSQRPEYTV